LETRGNDFRAMELLGGDLALVGHGDPNLSNRKFPYELKEEFDGPARRKALVELADAVVAKGVKEISGDVIGDDSYFSAGAVSEWLGNRRHGVGVRRSDFPQSSWTTTTVALMLTPRRTGGQSRARDSDSRGRRIFTV